MPHLIIEGTDTEKIIQDIHLHASVTFSKDFFINHAPRVKQKLDELENKLIGILEYYFDSANINSELGTNHEWNVYMREEWKQDLQASEQYELDLYERHGG